MNYGINAEIPEAIDRNDCTVDFVVCVSEESDQYVAAPLYQSTSSPGRRW